MKLTNSTLKSLIVFAMLLIAYVTNAQVQTVTLGDATVYNYVVDIDPANGGQSPDGTPGSTYTWSIDNAPAPAAVLTPNGNKASIDWSAVPVGIYTIQVIETNATCDPVTVDFEVEIIQPGDPELTWTDAQPICVGDDAVFEITDAPAGAVISYTATGGTPANGTVTVQADGTAQIIITHDGSNNDEIVVTLTSMDLNGTTITFTPEITETADVNVVLTSPIQLVP